MLPVLPRTAVKAVATLGLVGGVAAVLGNPVAADAQSAAQNRPAVTSSGPAAARGDVPARAARSGARVSPTVGAAAVESAATSPVLVERFGVVGVTAVAKAKPKPKPKPKPTPKPDAEPATQSRTASGSAGERKADGGGKDKASRSSAATGTDTAAYAGAGAALGLGPNAQAVYSAVRSRFGITNVGGYRAGDPGDHGSGRAADIMVSGAKGDAVAAYVQAHAAELRVKYVIWQQRIWLPGSGWRSMADRGSATANHYDHVHVSVR